MPVLVAPRGWYNLAGSNDSVLGVDVLQQFTLRIDYARERMWLRRVPEPKVTLYGADWAAVRRVGAFLERRGSALAVWGVMPDSPAARFGLRAGDAIVPAMGEEIPTLEEVLAKIEAGGELTVARRHGEVWVDLALPKGVGAGASEEE
jgi:predicted metalloprotease with PDZ domain